MLKILKNLKESLISVIIIVILLCLQAGTDLALPDYTSKIVNIGIQQGGIQNVSPEAIRKEQMENLLLFSTDDEKILNCYTLISKKEMEDKEYEKYLKQYPELENQDIYVLNNLKKEQKEELDTLIAKPLMIIYSISNEETAKEVKKNILQNTPKAQQSILEQADLLTIIKNMPEETRNNILKESSKMIDEKFGNMTEQVAIQATKQEYAQIGMDLDKIQNDYILFTGMQMLGIALISMIAAIIIMYLSSRVAAKLGQNLRNKVFKKVLGFSIEEFKAFSTASLITRSTNDIQQIQNLIAMLFRVVVYAPIVGIGGFIRVLNNSHTSMAWIIGLAILCILGIILTLFIIAMPKFKKLQELVDRLNLVAREILTGLPVIRAFNTEKKEEKRFEDANKILMKTNIFVNKAMSLMMPALMFVMNSVALLIIWVGGHNVANGNIQVGDMMAFIQYTMQIVISFLVISMISIMLPRAQVSANRINEILEKEPRIKDNENTKKFDNSKKGLVEFKNVSFRYPDADAEILTDINFTAEPGKTTAIIGSTGGELLIDGVNIKDVPQHELRKRIGFVPQKGLLFSGTIESNIKYGNPKMSDKQMKEAAEIAQATEFIEAKPEKYKSEIAQGGTNVSGGQKQRLSIARAIAIDPEIFVFDDSFSALDLKTDSKLRAALAEKTKNKTVIIVAQRVSTILNADQIVVLEEGKIVGIGKHQELMKNCDTYSQIALSQLSKEELE